MKRQLFKNSQTMIVVGIFALSFASVSFQWLHQDFLGGISFGIGLSLVLMGISAKRKHRMC